MLITFFNCEGMLNLEIFPEGLIVNTAIYRGVMDRLLKLIARVRTKLHVSKNLFLLDYNALSYNAVVIRYLLIVGYFF